MIVAKAANMDLVVLAKSLKWHQVDKEDYMFFSEHDEYFLCLPQHKDACLHWINGGDVQDLYNEEWTDCTPLSKTINTDSENSLKFSYHHMFMNEEFNFRIKPKKVKRWIAYGTNSQKMGVRTFSSKCECIDQYGDEGLNGPVQYFEIEIEE